MAKQATAVQGTPTSDPETSTDAALIADRYRVEATLGRGGAGAVLRVFDVSRQKQVALKQLSAGLSARVRTLFEREYYTLAGLHHPNIVEVYDYGTSAEGPYYTMELLSGSDLSAHAPLPFKEACRYVCEVASALSVLHRRRLLHRDVSPRNVWLCSDGRTKLIDFGALTPFGASLDVVGTPPMIAPEALHGQGLDQRTDLYALGALLYWLLTGVHAYPAYTLRELPQHWARAALPVNRRLAQQERDQVPGELEALVESLLSQNPLARPSSTAELIDRLSAAANLRPTTPQEREIAVPGTLLVGRTRERELFRSALKKRTGKAFLLEADPGMGRTRLLQEVAIEARVAGASVVHVEANLYSGPFAVAHALVWKVLDTLPQVAVERARDHAGILANLSEAMAARLDVPPVELSNVAGEARARMYNAIAAWLSQLSEHAPLVLLIDDLQRVDEPTLGLLIALMERTRASAIVLALSLPRNFDASQKAQVRTLRDGMRRLMLRPLDNEETRLLLVSMFGEVPHLMRLSERLFRAAEGNPGKIVAICDQLLRAELIRHVDASWMLPQEVPDQLLVYDVAASLAGRLSRLPHEAHALGRLLSLYDGFIAPEMARALSDLKPQAVFEALQALVSEDVLVGVDGGYRFRDDASRNALTAGLDDRERKLAHARIGAFLLAAPELKPEDELVAHVHLLQGEGQAAQNETSLGRIAQVAAELMLENPDRLRPVIPHLEQALALFRERQKGGHQQIALLSALTVAGYFVDRKLATTYGEEALATLTRVLGLGVARRLGPVLGKRLSLMIGLLMAGIGFARRKKDPCVPKLPDAIRMFFNCVGSLSGIATVCIDPRSIKRFVALLELWTGLGKGHFTYLIYLCTQGLLATVQDRMAETRELWRTALARLEHPETACGMPEDARIRYFAGGLYAAGVNECFRGGPEALRFAERLDAIGIHVARMSADQLRSLYYANRGDLALAEQYKRRVELAAAQYGSAWQVEIWSPGAAITSSLRTHDPMGTKQALEQLRRLAKQIPSQVLLAERCHGAHLLLRKRYHEAVEALESCLSETPLEVLGWGRTHATLARALNALGEHERAREVCERALSLLPAGDLEFPVMNLGLLIEHALALASVGQREQASSTLDALITHHTPFENPLTLGALHEAAARVALLCADIEACHHHHQAMDAYYRGTHIPSLIARCERLANELRRSLEKQGIGLSEPAGLTSGSASDLSSLTSVLSLERELSAISEPEARAQRALELMLPSESDQGAIWLMRGGQTQRLAQKDDALPDEIEAWVQKRSEEERLMDDVTVTDDATNLEATPLSDPNTLDVHGYQCHLFWLRSREGLSHEPLGALVLAYAGANRPNPNAELLDALARHLTAAAHAA